MTLIQRFGTTVVNAFTFLQMVKRSVRLCASSLKYHVKAVIKQGVQCIIRGLKKLRGA